MIAKEPVALFQTGYRKFVDKNLVLPVFRTTVPTLLLTEHTSQGACRGLRLHMQYQYVEIPWDEIEWTSTEIYVIYAKEGKLKGKMVLLSKDSLADPADAPHARPPLRVPILSLWHKNFTYIGILTHLCLIIIIPV